MDDENTPVVNVDVPDVYVDITIPTPAPTPEPTPVPTAEPTPVPTPDPVVTTSVNSFSSDGTGTLRDMVAQIFGDYQPQTVTVQVSQGDTSTTSEEVIPGIGGLDYYWIGGFLLFSIAFYSFFRLIGVIFK